MTSSRAGAFLRAAAVAQISHLPQLKGFPGWIIWVFLHIAMLLGNRNRFATLTNLTARYLTKGSHNVIVGEVPDREHLAGQWRWRPIGGVGWCRPYPSPVGVPSTPRADRGCGRGCRAGRGIPAVR